MQSAIKLISVRMPRTAIIMYGYLLTSKKTASKAIKIYTKLIFAEEEKLLILSGNESSLKLIVISLLSIFNCDHFFNHAYYINLSFCLFYGKD